MTDRDYENSSVHYNVNEARLRYEEYHHKLKDMERIDKLLYIDYVNMACKIVTRYSSITTIMQRAWHEQNEITKKNRPNYETIKCFISEDFFNNEEIKNLQISQCGYDPYGYAFKCQFKNLTFEITVPVTDNITVINFDNAHQNKISVYVKQNCDSHLLIESYDIKDISNAIKEYYEENGKYH